MNLFWLKRVGLAGVLGWLMLAGAAWTARVWLPQQRTQVEELGSQARRTRHEMQAQAQHSPVQLIRSPDQAWQTLWQALPVADKRVDLQASVLSAAKDQGLSISAVQYQGSRMPWSAHEGAVLWRQRMVMPVDGTYPAVRSWLAQLLKEPALSVDSVDIDRSDVMSDQVKARVSVSLWWRKTEVARP